MKRITHHKHPHKEGLRQDAGIIVKNQAIVGALLFVFSLFLVISILQAPQTLRQNAQTPSPPPKCAALEGICATNNDCTAHSGVNSGAQDCNTGQVCCAPPPVPPQCKALGGFCAPSNDCSSRSGVNSGAQDCTQAQICCTEPTGDADSNPTSVTDPLPSVGNLGDGLGTTPGSSQDSDSNGSGDIWQMLVNFVQQLLELLKSASILK